MAFESLLNRPMTEPELLELLISETQKSYGVHQNTYYFFKLSYVGDKKTQMIWVKSFDNPKDFADFFYDTKFFRTSFMLKFKNDHYEVFCRGFYYSDSFEIWPDKIMDSRPMVCEPYDADKTPMLPREVIERGFGEITQAVKSSRYKIPI